MVSEAKLNQDARLEDVRIERRRIAGVNQDGLYQRVQVPRESPQGCRNLYKITIDFGDDDGDINIAVFAGGPLRGWVNRIPG